MIIHNQQVTPMNPISKIIRDQSIIRKGIIEGKSLEQIAKENPNIKFVKFDEEGKIIKDDRTDRSS